MKTFFFLLCLLLALISSAESQWVYVYPSSVYNKNITSVYFSSAATGWITGDSGMVMKTTNGGDTWFNQITGNTFTLWSVFAINDNAAWVCGTGGKIYRTTNGGLNWIQQFSISTSMFYKIIFTDEQNGWICTNSSLILKTSNGGVNWNINYNSPYGGEINALAAPGKDTIIAAGQGGAVYVTYNRGTNWSASQPSNNWHTNAYFVNNCTGWICARDGGMLKTTNTGLNWISQNPGTSVQLNAVFFPNASTGFTAGTAGEIRKTTNGGTNWYDNRTVIQNNFYYSLYFHNALSGWVTGQTGVILKTTTGGLTFENSSGTEVPAHYGIKEIYPNPFNPSANVRFDVPEKSFVKISIFNSLGKETGILVNEFLRPGSYSYVWNAGNQSSGVYFCRMEAGNFADVKKMVLIR